MQPRYPIVLLDADGTLFDFSQAERQAFAITAGEYGWPEEAYPIYSAINESYWALLQQGEISRRQLFIRRFEDLLRALGLPGNPEEANAAFADNLCAGTQLLPGAEEICRDLSAHCRLIIATNSSDKTARARLAGSRLAPYIHGLVASEQAGAEKPNSAFFDYLFAQIGPVDKSKTLMVGDTLLADIKGGLDYGLDVCWYNPRNLPPPGDLSVTYIIASLDKLASVVLPSRNDFSL